MQRKSCGSVKLFYPVSREKVLALLRERLPHLAEALPLERVVLFGSCAKGRHTAFSDVDLLVVYRGPSREDAFRLVRTVLKIPGLEPHIYTSEEARTLSGVLRRMLEGGIVVYPEGRDGPEA